MRTQNSLANGDDKDLSLISVPETRRVGAMTGLLLIDSPRPLLFPITRVTGVPTAPPGLPLPRPRLLRNVKIQVSARRVEGRRTEKRPGLSVANSNRARMKAPGVSLARIEAEVTWAPRQVYLLIHLRTMIGGADQGQVSHHTAAHLVSPTICSFGTIIYSRARARSNIIHSADSPAHPPEIRASTTFGKYFFNPISARFAQNGPE